MQTVARQLLRQQEDARKYLAQLEALPMDLVYSLSKLIPHRGHNGKLSLFGSKRALITGLGNRKETVSAKIA